MNLRPRSSMVEQAVYNRSVEGSTPSGASFPVAIPGSQFRSVVITGKVTSKKP